LTDQLSKEALKNEVVPPLFCVMGILKSCMSRCKMCTMWKIPRSPDELTIKECKDFVTSLNDITKTPIEINILGGETLLKDGVMDLVDHVNKAGHTAIITTNGFLVDENMAKKFADSSLKHLTLSLDSHIEATHDFYRGTKGAFSKAMKAIDNVSRFCGNKCHINILSIIMKENLDELLKFAEWVECDDRLQAIYFMALTNAGLSPDKEDWYNSETCSQIWPADYAKVEKIMDGLINLKKKGFGKICNPTSQLNAFKSYYREPTKKPENMKLDYYNGYIMVESFGEVSLCAEKLGNMREHSVKDLWYSKNADIAREKIANNQIKLEVLINCKQAFPDD
jgi:MoaA/NifB/PqqE/SkfB family radical SAM enzyme